MKVGGFFFCTRLVHLTDPRVEQHNLLGCSYQPQRLGSPKKTVDFVKFIRIILIKKGNNMKATTYPFPTNSSLSIGKFGFVSLTWPNGWFVLTFAYRGFGLMISHSGIAVCVPRVMRWFGSPVNFN